MPRRKDPLITGQIYHVFNKTVGREEVFRNKRDCQRALQTLDYYRFQNPSVRLSKYLLNSTQNANTHGLFHGKNGKPLIEIFAYCLMPNHYHLLVKQLNSKGIEIFLSLFQNSYTKYFNTKHKREGHIFIGRFKAVRIETDGELLHVARYIHLNPYTGFVIDAIQKLESYQWSSFLKYLKVNDDFTSSGMILSHFKNIQELKKYVYDQADYQRRLAEIKHIAFD